MQRFDATFLFANSQAADVIACKHTSRQLVDVFGRSCERATVQFTVVLHQTLLHFAVLTSHQWCSKGWLWEHRGPGGTFWGVAIYWLKSYFWK